MSRSLTWYVKRGQRFMPGEFRWRVTDAVHKRQWVRAAPTVSSTDHRPDAVVGARADRVAAEVLNSRATSQTSVELLRVADRILAGQLEILGSERLDLVDPDWASDGLGAFDTPDLDGAPPMRPSMKHVWELSRCHWATLLAAAYHLTGDERYAVRCGELLRSFWRQHSTRHAIASSGGVEVALRLISWVWARRLLSGWSGIDELFREPSGRAHIEQCQEYLARFPSRFSSANNHQLAEAAGLLTASCAFDGSANSARWRTLGSRRLQDALDAQVAPSGMHREQAPAYQAFVIDLTAVATIELAKYGAEGDNVERLSASLTLIADALAACVDPSGIGPGFGDGDESTVARMDASSADPTRRSLALASSLIGTADHWPALDSDTRSTLIGDWAGGALRHRDRQAMTSRRRIADDGPTILTSSRAWLAVRTGRLGYLPIAAHAHADLLSFELRVDGDDLIVDPGTYCYGLYPAWRRYLRSTAAHNTLCVQGADQAEYWDGFMWGTDVATVASAPTDHPGTLTACVPWKQFDVSHRRRFTIGDDNLVVVDSVSPSTAQASTAGDHSIGICLTLGSQFERISPMTYRSRRSQLEVTFDMDGRLTWDEATAAAGGRGWVAERFGALTPTWAIIGSGQVPSATDLHSIIRWR